MATVVQSANQSFIPNFMCMRLPFPQYSYCGISHRIRHFKACNTSLCRTAGGGGATNGQQSGGGALKPPLPAKPGVLSAAPLEVSPWVLGSKLDLYLSRVRELMITILAVVMVLCTV